MKKIITLILFMIFFILFDFDSVSPTGVSYPSPDPLTIYPEWIGSFSFSVQNVVSEANQSCSLTMTFNQDPPQGENYTFMFNPESPVFVSIGEVKFVWGNFTVPQNATSAYYNLTLKVTCTPQNVSGVPVIITFNVPWHINVLPSVPPQYSNIKTNFTSPLEYQQNLALQFNSTWTNGTQSNTSFTYGPNYYPVDTILFSTNYTGQWRNYSVATNSSSEYYHSIQNPSIGTFGYIWYANDTKNNWNSTDLQNFTIQDTTLPTISNVTITPNTTTNGTIIAINATITDIRGVNSSTVKAYIQKPDETILANITLTNVNNLYNGTWNTTGFSAGTYFVDINATDVSGNQRKENNIATIVLSAESDAIEGNIINNTVSTVNNQTTVTVTTSSTTNVTLEITTNQTISNASVSVTEYSKNPAGSGFTLTALGKYIEIDVSPELENALKWTIIKIYYTDTEVSTAGLDESSLRIEYYNATDGTWTTYSTPFGNAPSSEVNTTANFVRANTTHFSVLGLFGSSPTTTTIPSSGGGGGGGGSSMIIPTNTTITSSTTIPLTTVTPKGLEITTTTIFVMPTKRPETLGIADMLSMNTRNALLLVMVMVIIFVPILVWKSP